MKSESICFITSYFDFPRQRMLDYYEKILPKNTKIFLFCKNSEINKFKTKRVKKIGYSSGELGSTIKLRKFCKENNIDVITNLARRLKMILLMIYATIFTETKIIFYEHGKPRKRSMIALAFLQFFINRTLIASEDLKERLQKYLFLNKSKVFCLPTSIDTNFWKPLNRTKTRKDLKIGLKEEMIIFVGRIQYMKGSDFLLEIIRRNPNRKFLLIGQMMDKEYDLKKLKNVIHIPFANKEQLINYYNASNLFLFLSRSEGLGLAFREAMSCGTPAILSDIEALRLIKAAKIVPFDLEKIQGEIERFFNLSKKQRQKLSEETREYIVDNFSEEKLKMPHLKQFLDI